MRFLRLLPAAPLLFAVAHAALRAPYEPDAHTLHLYQFETPSGARFCPNLGKAGRRVFALSSRALAAPGVLGAAGAPGFGLAANLTGDGHLLGYDADGDDAFLPEIGHPSPDRVALSSLGIDGASPFTLEALVHPGPSGGAPREIIATDSSSVARGFQFRLVTDGAARLIEFHLVGTNQRLTAALPSDGPHAYAEGRWFHVAFVYTGTSARFYWTALNSAADAAQPVGPAQVITFSATRALEGPLVLGNENRGPAGESLAGLLDQVRISDIARAPEDFVFERLDADRDGLSDDWEIRHFGNLSAHPDADPDRDGLANRREHLDGSDPLRPTDSADIDGDGLPDQWEKKHFGGLAHSATEDPDGDGENNLAELKQGTAPDHRASFSADTDADSLPDAWEWRHFRTLAHNGGDDPDSDGFSNLQESLAATDPASPAARPPGPVVKLVPVDDGDPATSEYGYAGASSINAVAFVRSALQTVGNQQFLAWYGRHQNAPAAAFNNTLWIGRRTLGSSRWEIFKHPSFTANNIEDGHDVVCFGIDGAGFMHLSWGMHGDAFHYSKSTTPVTGSGPIALGPDTSMTGKENGVTYPQFLRLPDGDLFYLFREGGSGSGDVYLNRYDVAAGSWANVHRAGANQLPFIKGAGWRPDYNAYPNMPQVDAKGDLVLTWCWRYGSDSPARQPGYQTNNHVAYARSHDGGFTWLRSDGARYHLPISRDGENNDPATAAEHILTIPEGSSLINQAGMCLDAAGQPVIASWWAPGAATGDHRRQYMVVFRDASGTWRTRTISNRRNNPPATKHNEGSVRDLGRPVVVMDRDERIIVVYRDDDGASNGLTVAHSLPRAEDPDRLKWTTFDLTTENLGSYEPVIDHELWARDKVLHFLHQPAAGKGYTPPANTAARISVLEWDAAAHFRSRP